MARVLRNFLFVLLLAGGSSLAQAAEDGVSSSAIAAVLQGDGDLHLAGQTFDRTALLAFYEPRAFAPIWTAERSAELNQALGEAESHGLDAANYVLPEAPPAAREVLRTGIFLRYAAVLAQGVVAPAEVDSDWTIAQPRFDGLKVLAHALQDGVATTLAALAPSDPAYLRLRKALAIYHGYKWRPLATKVLKPGDSGDGIAALRERLAAENYAAGDGDTFDDPLQAAVKRFQAAHGLADDGAVGRGTLAALNVSAAQRVKEIRLNLERWRSLPRDWAATRVEVNVPAAMASFYQPDQPPFTMRAIVGSPDHPTPVLRARMVSVLLNPPWKVPSSIIEHEIRPALKKDPKYLQRNDFAYVEVAGGHELQQLPGPKNALGSLKFEMPNPDDIYLHDTPARFLFKNTRRAMSHGCVRLEDPRGLATQVLAAAPEWPRTAIDSAIATGVTQRIMLPHSLPVYILYFTAFADEDGTVEFRNDVYGRDQRLAAALEAADRHPPTLSSAGNLSLTKSLSAAAQ